MPRRLHARSILMLLALIFASQACADVLYDNLLSGNPANLRQINSGAWYAEKFIAPTDVTISSVTLYMENWNPAYFPSPWIYSQTGGHPDTPLATLINPEANGWQKTFRPVGGMGYNLSAGSYWIVLPVYMGMPDVFRWGWTEAGTDPTGNAYSADQGSTWEVYSSNPLVMKVETSAGGGTGIPERATLWLMAPVAALALYLRRGGAGTRDKPKPRLVTEPRA